jgi:hypothetical protein
MQDEVKTENADSVENTANTVVEEVVEQPQSEEVQPTTNTTTNMSPEDFINSRLSGETPQQDAVEEESEPTDNAESEGSEETETDVLSQVDLDDMSEEELRELSEKLGSRAVARFGELTAKRKAAEEKAAALEAQIQENKSQKRVSMSDMDQNPYKDLKDIKAVQKKAKEVSQIVEWAEDVLFESDSYSPSDSVAEFDGKSVTKKEVRDILKNARRAQKKHIPQKVQHLKSQAQGQQMAEGFNEKVRQEIPWTSDPENETNKRYQNMLADKRLQSALAQADPTLKAQMPYLLAHAANSIFGERTLVDVAEPVKATKSIDPPKSVSNTAAKTEKRTSTRTKNIQTNKHSFRSSGGVDDFIKLRTAQLSR